MQVGTRLLTQLRLFYLKSVPVPGFSQYFTEDSYRVEVVKAGRYTLVDLNRGDIATDILR